MSRSSTAPAPRPTVIHGPAVTKLSDVQPTRVQWLWPDRIALGKLTLLAGDPGLGKSYLTLDLAARVSAGLPLPGQTAAAHAQPPRPHHPDATQRHAFVSNPSPSAGVRLSGDRGVGHKVVLLSAEDDPADTIRPRLDAAGADCDHIVLMHGIRFAEKERAVNLREDVQHLDHLVGSMAGACRLVVIDPISAYLGDDEGHSNTKVRNMLRPLSDLAQKHGVAVVAVTHLNKGGGNGGPQSAIYRTMGSLAFTAAARAVHLIARDPADDPAHGGTGQRRLMLPVKNNLGGDQTGWGFALSTREFADPSGGDPDDYPDGRRQETKIIWDPRPTQDTADALLLKIGRVPGGSEGHRSTPAMDEAVAFLKDALSPGPRPAKEVQAEAAEHGISGITLRRCRETLGVQATRTPGPPPSSLWSLPDSPPPQPPHDQLDLI